MSNENLDPKDGTTSIGDWWDYHHRGKGDFLLWLTGSSGPEVWRYLNIERHIRPGTVVLNIGVGLGHCTKELAQRKCIVHGYDISPIALAQVEPFTVKTWTPSTIRNIPENTIDLAISNLVTQHMNDVDLSHQVAGVLKSLKPSGIFAMQFAFARDSRYNDLTDQTTESMKIGAVCRSLSGMIRIVEKEGGAVIWSSRIGIFPKFGSGWYGIHIVRSDFPYVSSDPAKTVDGSENDPIGQRGFLSGFRDFAGRAANRARRVLFRLTGGASYG